MVNNPTLRAVLRDGTGKGPARRMRREGRIPAVIYGHGEQTRSLAIDAHELDRLFAHISVENTVITLEIEGVRAGAIKALVREVQVHPFRGDVIHVDFLQLRAGEKVGVEVPIRLIGTAAGVRGGGMMQQILHELSVTCLPDQIPEAIEVDVSAMEVGDSVHVGDLAVPAGVTVELEADRTVCTVVPPTVEALEEEPEEPEGVGGDVEPEVIRKRPTDEEAPDEA